MKRLGFEVTMHRSKRVRLLESDGREEYAEPETWQRLGATEESHRMEIQTGKGIDFEKQVEEIEKGQDGNDGEGMEEDDVPTPLEAIETLTAARGELQLVLDLVNKVVAHQEVGVPNIPDSRNPTHRLRQLAEEAALRCGSRQRTLSEAAGKLKQGAQALRERCRRENNFYQELAKLQGFWKVQHNPVASETSFSIDLSLGRIAEQQNNPLPPVVKIDIYQHPLGKVKVQTEGDTQTRNWEKLPREPKTSEHEAEASSGDDVGEVVAVGGNAVHRLLLEKQQKIVWKLLGDTLYHQGSHSGHGNFLYTLTHKLLARTATSTTPCIASFKPFLLQHFLGHLFQCPMSMSMTSPPDGTRLLSDVVSWLGHALWARKLAWKEVDKQAMGLGNICLHWQLTWHPCLSAIRVIVPKRFNGLLLIRGNKIELDGLLKFEGGSKHMTMDISHKEIPELVRSLSQDVEDGLFRF